MFKVIFVKPKKKNIFSHQQIVDGRNLKSDMDKCKIKKYSLRYFSLGNS